MPERWLSFDRVTLQARADAAAAAPASRIRFDVTVVASYAYVSFKADLNARIRADIADRCMIGNTLPPG